MYRHHLVQASDFEAVCRVWCPNAIEDKRKENSERYRQRCSKANESDLLFAVRLHFSTLSLILPNGTVWFFHRWLKLLLLSERWWMYVFFLCGFKLNRSRFITTTAPRNLLESILIFLLSNNTRMLWKKAFDLLVGHHRLNKVWLVSFTYVEKRLEGKKTTHFSVQPDDIYVKLRSDERLSVPLNLTRSTRKQTNHNTPHIKGLWNTELSSV